MQRLFCARVYEFSEVVLPPRGAEFWDGSMTHDPAVVRWRDLFPLFYTGTRYEGEAPNGNSAGRKPDLGARSAIERGEMHPAFLAALRNQRIGVAVALHLRGPWQRMDTPVLQPRPDCWDALITTNPAPCVTGDGALWLVYKSLREPGGLMHLGLAAADAPGGPYRRLLDGPILDSSAEGEHLEDPFLWQDADGFHLLAKDMNGGMRGAGVLFTSPDGMHWDPAMRRSAYSRDVAAVDGSVTRLDFFERPQLLIEDGRPTHLFAAAAVGGPDHTRIRESWNAVIAIS